MFTLTHSLAPDTYWTTRAPTTAPMMLRRPPTNSMISSDSSAAALTSVAGTNSWDPAYTAPPSAANMEPSTNSSSLRRGVAIPIAAAVRSSTPSAYNSRPMSECRIRLAMKTTTPSATTATTPLPTAIASGELACQRLPDSGMPTDPPR